MQYSFYGFTRSSGITPFVSSSFVSSVIISSHEYKKKIWPSFALLLKIDKDSCQALREIQPVHKIWSAAFCICAFYWSKTQSDLCLTTKELWNTVKTIIIHLSNLKLCALVPVSFKNGEYCFRVPGLSFNFVGLPQRVCIASSNPCKRVKLFHFLFVKTGDSCHHNIHPLHKRSKCMSHIIIM